MPKVGVFILSFIYQIFKCVFYGKYKICLTKIFIQHFFCIVRGAKGVKLRTLTPGFI